MTGRQTSIYTKIQQAIGPHEDLLTIVKRRKLQWYGHVSRSSGSGQNHLARHSERGKKTRRTKEEVGRQHQGMDRPGVRQVPEGSGEQGKMEKTGCKIICGAPTTLAVKGLMMMMMMFTNKVGTSAYLVLRFRGRIETSASYLFVIDTLSMGMM